MTTVVAPKEIVPATIEGKALYLELVINSDLSHDEKRRIEYYHEHSPVKQIIVFPAWENALTGEKNRVRFMSRVVSTMTPRSQWEWARDMRPITEPQADENPANDYATYESISKDDLLGMSEADKDKAGKLALEVALRRAIFDEVTTHTADPVTGDTSRVTRTVEAWVLRDEKPFVVEITNEDLQAVEQHQTPQAVIRRITKVRNSLSAYPDKLA